MTRDMLFVSHANPEDNEFTLWLTLRLAGEGYPVWCDLTKLLGGEDFWKDIEEAIRERTLKFLYVLSRTSNGKPGPLQELQVAHNVMRQQHLNDFIIPLLIDNLSHQDMNIQLARLNAVSFNHGWAKGLNILLEKLEREGVSKNSQFTPNAVCTWWRTQFSADKGTVCQPEEQLSNWFEIQPRPSPIHFHKLHRTRIGKLEVPSELPFPAFQHEHYLITFAKAEDFTEKLGESIAIETTISFSTQDFLDGKVEPRIVERKEAKNFVYRLLRLGWEKMLTGRWLPSYELANNARCLYFTKGFVNEKDEISFTGVNGKETSRQVVGYKSIKTGDRQAKQKRYWHFGIQAKPLVYPVLGFIIKPHVIFSDDGANIWESKERLHKARRSQCKNWWNAEWRDRILATMMWLSKDGMIEVQVGSDRIVYVSASPVTFTSPVSYTEPIQNLASIMEEEEKDIDYFDDEEIEEDE